MSNIELKDTGVSSNLSEGKVLIAYHANCTDGFTSAWVCASWYRENGTNFKLLPMAYGQKSERELIAQCVASKPTTVLIVDFSVSLWCLRELHLHCPSTEVNIFDHHKTAFETYAGCSPEELEGQSWVGIAEGANITLDNNFSGAGLCWDVFYGAPHPVPKIVRYVQDYDLWRFIFGDTTRYISQVLKNTEQTLEQWDELAATMEDEVNFALLKMQGQKLLEAHEAKVSHYVELAKPVALATPGNPIGLCVYCDEPKLISDLGNKLAAKRGTYGLVVTMDVDSLRFKWSLRSEGDYDVSLLAKHFGGGGHKNAAGFISDVSKCLVPLSEIGEK